MTQPTQTTPGALAGLRVIDLSRVLGGPFCTQMLADHGAQVIKVEPPQGDETRDWGPPFLDGAASYFLGVNRNKQGVALDLSLPEGRALLLRLLADADVLVENFKPGTLERWGIGYEDFLRERFPRLVHCRVSGFGADGPLGGLPGYDAVAQAMTGLMSVNGERGGAPLRMGIPVIDIATGLHAVIGILMALRERELSGRGQSVEATLFDTGVSLMHPHLPNHFLSGRVAGRSGNAHPNICPYDAFATRSVGVFIAVGNDGQFRRLVALLGRAELADDPRFSHNSERLANAAALKAELEALLATRDGEAIAQELMRAGVPCGPVLDVGGVRAHPHALHRERFVEAGGQMGVASAVSLSRTPASYRTAAPAFGAHSLEVLRAAGLGEAELAEATRAGAIPHARSSFAN